MERVCDFRDGARLVPACVAGVVRRERCRVERNGREEEVDGPAEDVGEDVAAEHEEHAVPLDDDAPRCEQDEGDAGDEAGAEQRPRRQVP